MNPKTVSENYQQMGSWLIKKKRKKKENQTPFNFSLSLSLFFFPLSFSCDACLAFQRSLEICKSIKQSSDVVETDKLLRSGGLPTERTLVLDLKCLMDTNPTEDMSAWRGSGFHTWRQTQLAIRPIQRRGGGRSWGCRWRIIFHQNVMRGVCFGKA